MPKEIYEMTLSAYTNALKGQRIPHSYRNRTAQIQVQHRDSIIHALQLGKGMRIPKKVIDDFRREFPTEYHKFVEIPQGKHKPRLQSY